VTKVVGVFVLHCVFVRFSADLQEYDYVKLFGLIDDFGS
jgi:hypothetical protein